eukprot:gene21514-16434_t
MFILGLTILSVSGGSHWLETDDAVKGDHRVTFTVAMHPAPGSQEKVARLLDDVSNPDSVSYGQYLSPEELRALTATPVETVNRVLQAFAGADCNNLGGSALLCTANAAVAEQLLDTKLARFQHSRTGDVAIKVATTTGLGVRVPASIASEVVFVSGINQLIEPRSRTTSDAADAVGGKGSLSDPITVPETIRKLYNVTIRGEPSVVQAAGEFP